MKIPRNRMEHPDTRNPNPPENKPVPILERRIWEGPAVDYMPGQCPNCGSQQSRIVATFAIDPALPQFQKRRHECQKCNVVFRSQQRLHPVDFQK